MNQEKVGEFISELRKERKKRSKKMAEKVVPMKSLANSRMVSCSKSLLQYKMAIRKEKRL